MQSQQQPQLIPMVEISFSEMGGQIPMPSIVKRVLLFIDSLASFPPHKIKELFDDDKDLLETNTNLFMKQYTVCLLARVIKQHINKKRVKAGDSDYNASIQSIIDKADRRLDRDVNTFIKQHDLQVEAPVLSTHNAQEIKLIYDAVKRGKPSVVISPFYKMYIKSSVSMIPVSITDDDIVDILRKFVDYCSNKKDVVEYLDSLPYAGVDHHEGEGAECASCKAVGYVLKYVSTYAIIYCNEFKGCCIDDRFVAMVEAAAIRSLISKINMYLVKHNVFAYMPANAIEVGIKSKKTGKSPVREILELAVVEASQTARSSTD